MTLRNSVLYIMLAMLCSCGTSKQVSTFENLPEWVKSKPIMEGFYVGLGAAQKTLNTSEYQQGAKNNALSDLASEISVKISSQSVINQFENNSGYSEDYTASTKLWVQENIEGYELVNTYESESEYYVLYKLSKFQYNELKEQRKTTASQKASDYFLKAVDFKERSEIYNAIINYVKGLESLKLYLNESIQLEYKGKTLDLGNALYSGLMVTLNDISIVPRINEIDATKGKAISSDKLHFKVQTKAGEPIYSIPVIFSLGLRPLRNNTIETNANGEVSYALSNVILTTGSTYFEAKIDANTLANNCTSDALFRRILRKMEMPKGQILIKVENPSFFIESDEKNLGKELDTKMLKKKMEQLLTNNNYPVVYQKDKANYTIKLQTNTSSANKEGRMHYSILTGEILIFNSSEQLVLSNTIKDIKGVQLNFPDAGLDAYNNLALDLNQNFLPKLKEALQ